MKIFTMLKIITISSYILWMILFRCNHVDAIVGINWGNLTSKSFVPSVLVDLLLQNNVSDVRLYNSDESVISAFAGSGIRITSVITNAQDVNESSAVDWIRTKIYRFKTVDFRYVLVGVNGFADSRFTKKPFGNVVNAVNLIQKTLQEFGYDNTKAILSNSYTGVLAPNITRPSDAMFNPDVVAYVIQTLHLFNQTGAPYVIDFMPIFYLDLFKINVEFAFFEGSSHVIKDIDGVVYTNLFDYVFDCFVWALRKVGFGNMKIVVGQIGWPTDGFPTASVENAERFFKGLLPHVSRNKGTPMKPGEPIDIFIHTMADETTNPAFLPFMRHFGIYRANGVPKYKIDLTGQGRDIYPATAKGINYMPSRWCVFNNKTSDTGNVESLVQFACQYADCTSLSPGASCGMLTRNEMASYAFNAYYQTNFQSEESCTFEGLGEIVLVNPSRGRCIFMVEVVRGNREPLAAPKYDKNQANRSTQIAPGPKPAYFSGLRPAQ